MTNNGDTEKNVKFRTQNKNISIQHRDLTNVHTPSSIGFISQV